MVLNSSWAEPNRRRSLPLAEAHVLESGGACLPMQRGQASSCRLRMRPDAWEQRCRRYMHINIFWAARRVLARLPTAAYESLKIVGNLRVRKLAMRISGQEKLIKFSWSGDTYESD